MEATMKPCKKCEGTGLKLVSASFLDRIEETVVFCPQCQGTGRVLAAEPVQEQVPEPVTAS